MDHCYTRVSNKKICVVQKSKRNEWEQRLDSLGEQVQYWTQPENVTDKTVEVIQLFYDI